VVGLLHQLLQERGAVVRPWTAPGTFPPGHSFLETLAQLVGEQDFGVCVAGAHDSVDKRGTPQRAPRDNVLLELGMFVGALGRDRAFLLVPRDVPMALPTDYLGIGHITYDAPHPQERLSDRASVLNPVVMELWDAMARIDLSRRSPYIGGTRVIGAYAGRSTVQAGILEVNGAPGGLSSLDASFGLEVGPSPFDGTPEGMYAALVDAVKQTAERAPGQEIDAISLVLPGLIDVRGRRVRLSATALPPDEDVGVKLASQLVEADLAPNVFGAWGRLETDDLCERIYIDNDANAVARYDLWSRGRARGRSSYVYVLIDEGVGGALVLNGKLYYGSSGGAGEIGHHIVSVVETLPSLPVEFFQSTPSLACPCGAIGVHWEGLIDPDGVFRLAAVVDNERYTEIIKSTTTPDKIRRTSEFLSKLTFQAGRVTEATSIEPASRSHKYREYFNSLIDAYSHLVAVGLANMANMLDVNSFVLGGRVVESMKNARLPDGEPRGFDFRRRLRKHLARYVLGGRVPDCHFTDFAGSDMWKGAALLTYDREYAELLLGRTYRRQSPTESPRGP